MEGALDLNNVHELQSELSRLYRALEESDHDIRKYRGTESLFLDFSVSLLAENKSLREDKLLYASSAKAADSGDAGQTAKKIIELSKKVRNVTAEMESAKTKVRNTEKENRELKAKNELLAAKMKQNNMDSNVSDSASAFSLQNLSKRYEAELREKSRKEKELQTQIEQLQLEIKSQKKILEQELGENFTSASSLLNGNWKGRQNQIMALQSRIKGMVLFCHI
jgi:cell division septum initiation protein DivIVA